LQARTLTEETRKAFEAGGHALSDRVVIQRFWHDSAWILQDWGNAKLYQIFIRPNNLQVRLETARPILNASVVGAAQHKASVEHTKPTKVLFSFSASGTGSINSDSSYQIVQTAFTNNQHSLSPNFFVRPFHGRNWHLWDKDNGKDYLLMRDGANIQVYDNLALAHPPGTDTQFFGFHEPVNLNIKPPGTNVPKP
jgi:hypothetical protein